MSRRIWNSDERFAAFNSALLHFMNGKEGDELRAAVERDLVEQFGPETVEQRESYPEGLKEWLDGR